MSKESTIIPHPAIAAGCTLEQVAAFEKIADGLDRYVSTAMTVDLMQKGLVRHNIYLNTFSDRFFVPDNHLVQWRAWCQQIGRNTEG